MKKRRNEGEVCDIRGNRGEFLFLDHCDRRRRSIKAGRMKKVMCIRAEEKQRIWIQPSTGNLSVACGIIQRWGAHAHIGGEPALI